MAPNRKTDKTSLASTASDQIRAIIEAAEQTAAQIRAEAEQEAAGIRRQAEEEASGIHSQARSDVRDLLESIRSGLGRLRADVELLEEKLNAAPPEAPPKPVATTAADAPTPAAAAPPPADPDLESARLVALNMALEGTGRDDVDRYLSENFQVPDRKALLDEVYALVGS
jgi:hypothetical protein